MASILRVSLVIISAPLFVACSYTFYPSACDYPLPGALRKAGTLPTELNETSGLERFGDGYVSFNDSGGEPELYFLDRQGRIVHIMRISNAENADWEDMASDGEYFYVADVGNNFGTRDTLTIYRVEVPGAGASSSEDAGWAMKDRASLPEEGTSLPEEVSAKFITFSFADPTGHAASGLYSHDCESLVAFGDSLYIFTKNWVELTTTVYAMPRVPGHYLLEPQATFDVRALITAADISPAEREMVLLGYRNMVPVMIRYRFGDTPATIACGGKARKYLRHAGRQTEGLCIDPSGRIVVSAEKTGFPQSLFVTH